MSKTNGKRAVASVPSAAVGIPEAASLDAADLLDRLQSDATSGLTSAAAGRRLREFGANEIQTETRKSWWRRLLDNMKDPLFSLLLALGVISFFTGDVRATVLITAMLALSVSLRFVQEMRADRAAEKLKALVRTTATVLRDGERRQVPLRSVVPGDIVCLSAGNFVPGDVRLVSSRDLYLNQASLTGESMPVEKHADAVAAAPENALDVTNVCFMGTNVASGTGTAVVLATGRATRFGELAARIAAQPEAPTSFDRGVDRYTWLMIRFIMVLVPTVFLINGLTKNDWLEAVLFAVAVAVGLTPELLPMIVTVNLSKGALDLSRRKVIVKRLNAIQDIGAVDILCTDKTGTLTEGRVALIRHVDINGDENEEVLDYAFLNSNFQTGLDNLLDDAVLKHDGVRERGLTERFGKVDEIPFDFRRRRMSVAVRNGKADEHVLICKGAVEEVLAASTSVAVGGKVFPLDEEHARRKDELVRNLSEDGFRLIALAVRRMPSDRTVYTAADETEMTLLGFLAFLDPPKASAAKAIAELERYGVNVKILTGDNELVTRKICGEVGMHVTRILRGAEIEEMTDDGLALAAEEANVFDKLEPQHKERVIKALQGRGHVVGFLGDGINDAPALKAADVGISVESAADIAKESSDVILLERSLMVLKEGVVEGRRAFGNIVKYIKMTASSNFGNMFSVVGASVFLPFLPMMPLQVIANNLLYDLSQSTIPTDSVDEEYLRKPRQWNIDRIKTFILVIGPVSSLFDYATYFMMLYVFNCWTNPALFHTGWFFESLLTQTLIVHVIRTRKVPFFQSRASWPLTLTTVAIIAFGAWLPYSPLASTLGFVPLPWAYWPIMAGFLLAYFALTQLVKNWYARRWGWD